MKKTVFGLDFIKTNNRFFESKRKKIDLKSKWSWQPHDMNAALREEAVAFGHDLAVKTNYRPGKKRKSVILIFNFGLLNSQLIQAAEAAGVEFFFLNYLNFSEGGEIHVDLNHPEQSYLAFDGAKLLLRDIRTVFWAPILIKERWSFFDYSPRSTFDTSEILFESRWMYFLRNLEGLLGPETLWLPGVPEQGSQEKQNKITDYAVASRHGFAVPDLIFSNEPESILKFHQGHSRVLFREFSNPPYIYYPRNSGITQIRSSKESLSLSPCVFQEYVDKSYELRVVIFLGQVHAFRIDSQNSEVSKEDWRVNDVRKVEWRTVRLPRRIQKKLIQLIQAQGLSWGAVDLIVQDSGRMVYLETNRPGSTLFLEGLTGFNFGQHVIEAIRKSWSPL